MWVALYSKKIHLHKRVMKLCFCCMAFISILGVQGSEWSASIPASVSGLSGLCIYIPCNFSYPGPRQPAGKLTGIWFQGSTNFQIYNSMNSEVVNALYLNRTRLVGSLARNECSLKIGPLRSSDAKIYTFRIEIPDLDKYSYLQQSTTVSIIDAPSAPSMQCPGILAEGIAVSLVCAVVHSCPEAAPALHWSSIRAEQTIAQPQSRRLLQNGWEERVVLNLLPSSGSHGEVLRCSAVFPSGLSQFGPECRLVVDYAPKNVTVNVSSPLDSVLEGNTVILSCQADSHPAPHTFSWFQWAAGREQLLTAQRGHELYINKIIREPGQYWCQAENTMGIAHSQPLLLDVLYQPEIMNESCCSVISEQELELNCVCIAHGNPKPSINWTFMHSHEPINGQVDSSQSGGHKAVVSLNTSVLWNSTAKELVILCMAENSLSSTTKAFTLTLNTTLNAFVLSDTGPTLGLWGPMMGLTAITMLLPQWHCGLLIESPYLLIESLSSAWMARSLSW
ncbi:myelin-associated glycoprotein-like isoform X2 [Electrophorus electricus]|uniref:myelin-associated glycoprotein-like isoform X2 n=1 Tax=Electrophorus electricus TaxID=8005 RepID=UPI0015D0A696|nr:myelin-associated glycoprotein-like isoform X2 [Electrophorus electricus]